MSFELLLLDVISFADMTSAKDEFKFFNAMKENFMPKEITGQQSIFLSISINAKLSRMAKDGFYLSKFFINCFDKKYLDDILEDWENTTERFNFQNKLKEIVTENIERIEENVKSSIKGREHIISEIFKLFEIKCYSGMITLALSQIDGVMKEITKGKNGFYDSNSENKKENPNRLKYLDAEIYVHFFSDYELLNVENRNDYELFKKDITEMSLLNRHSILHGESKEFGNELNAIKIILLLVFIASIFDANNDEVYK